MRITVTGIETIELQDRLPLDKAERKRVLREKSFEWADGLHGKHIMVFWEEDTASIFCDQDSSHHARGIAYRIQNASGGWGQIKVILDQKEHSRIEEIDDYHWSNGKKVPYKKPIIDGQKYGLFLNRAGGECYTVISWGSRASVILDEKGGQNV